MRTTSNRMARLLVSAAAVALPLTACAAVGGGGDQDSDCESDVSGSELTPVATGAFGEYGDSCNNNQFVDTDLDAYAYPATTSSDDVFVYCNEFDDEAATFTLFDVTSGIPEEVLSGDCDNQNHDYEDTAEGDRFVLVIEHSASSDGAEFYVAQEN